MEGIIVCQSRDLIEFSYFSTKLTGLLLLHTSPSNIQISIHQYYQQPSHRFVGAGACVSTCSYHIDDCKLPRNYTDNGKAGGLMDEFGSAPSTCDYFRLVLIF